MEVPPNEPESAIQSRVRRRWRGLGLILFVGFYSLYFAAHVRLADTVVYLKNDAISSAQTASVFSDLIAGREEAKAVDTAVHPLFVLMHQPAAQLAIRGWERLSQDTNSARKHAVAVLTAGAAALTVTLLYQTLLWTGVATWRAALFACVQGASTMAGIWAAVPEVWVFAGLGLVAMLWAVARGDHGRWWELPLAAVYAVGCLVWSAVPALVLALVAVFRGSGQGAWLARLFSALGTVAVVVSFALMLGRLQQVVFPRMGPVFSMAALKGEMEAVAGQVTGGVWKNRERLRRVAQTAVFSSVVAPEPTAGERVQESTGLARRSVSFQDDRWLQMDFHHAVWGAWALLLVLGLGGLPVAVRHHPAMGLALLVCAGWGTAVLLLFRPEMERVLPGCVAVPVLVGLCALGVEGATRFWRALALPVTLLLMVFVAAQAVRNWQLVLELDSLLRL